ncbi:hypothetical protein [Nocardiopsis synnemataformans]|uniref:hypothetical protein n=1 Tax=Nocardiopsis synnemataformans TaxID=61305 RepID=UPI003EB8C204
MIRVGLWCSSGITLASTAAERDTTPAADPDRIPATERRPPLATITVLGETTTLSGARQRHLRTDDGQRWVVSAYRGRFFPEGQTLVMRADAHGDSTGDDVVELDGCDLDAAQAEFERRYRAGTLPAEQPRPEHQPGVLADEEACQALRRALFPARRLHITPEL